jgi:hypothetical protein
MTSNLQVSVKIPQSVCGFVTTLCKHQAKVKQNREKENFCATGKGSAQSRNYSKFKLDLSKD